MAVTKPVKNQIAFWEKIEVINDATGIINIDINKSTSFLINLTGNINIEFEDISFIPDNSLVSLSLFFNGNGTYTVTMPSSCKTTTGIDVSIMTPNLKLAVQLFTIDKGLSWKVAPISTDF